MRTWKSTFRTNSLLRLFALPFFDVESDHSSGRTGVKAAYCFPILFTSIPTDATERFRPHYGLELEDDDDDDEIATLEAMLDEVKES